MGHFFLFICGGSNFLSFLFARIANIVPLLDSCLFLASRLGLNLWIFVFICLDQQNLSGAKPNRIPGYVGCYGILRVPKQQSA